MDDEIDPSEVESLLDSEDPPRVVDIRSPGAFARFHIPGSENVPFAELPDRVASLEGADRIVTVCPHGKASIQAARLIKSYEGTADARVESMRGGLEAWEGPLEEQKTAAEPDEGPEAPF
ncbi:rhodanese-like domain-containing protein [Halogeometricum borinquense]|uniref:Rhodanese-like domain-containing protein n=1 Tax=Halogeometricum borinquense TaxID=60847 RepID=A0A482TEQ0_9EURY|nr:rhodanese-like domain-containing protein [Halogeometricum borinquense]QIB75882.1 rhodanese-like domain-containing protein [Halogeometricum borinquense]QIQ75535.1 rhodanese-like domain-containing protein [Halogeometricum borinquense]RYJ14816.1 rhodanese-like domain-containing protein [Halogeometricum borinquense]